MRGSTVPQKSREEKAMKKNLITAVLMTVATTVLLGIIYPLVITGLSQVLFAKKANGQLIEANGKIIGSRLIGQGFSGAAYFHSRPSAAGTGYDPTSTNGSQLGPTNHQLIDRVKSDVAALQSENPGAAVPIDLVTTSASGLDPHITPAAAEFQVPRVARQRGISEDVVREAIRQHTEARQFGFLGEPRVNVLELNLTLDEISPKPQSR
jgi:K+-transporting ATPase ATPase C chain